ncbi:sensor histidine kinase [Nocardioides sediminis]|uniref:sensor histidine kinase n=1 Tax=Nocardioides sediminis TaxID=433648 RepID=UPI00131F4335|nr:sensor histidine kinase [Nocardioides sediminis]
MTTATHSTLFYDGAEQYAAEAGDFLRDGLGRGHRGLVMAPPRRVDQLRSALGGDADEVTFVEDTVAYAPQWNVYRVLLDFAAAAPGVRSCVVAEQTLAGRVPAEVVDYRRLEAAVNVVFASADVDLLCPYDAGSLPPHLLDIGRRTHAAVRADGDRSPNARYDDPFDVLAGLAAVRHPPERATTIDCSSPVDVAEARRLVRARGADAGLAPDVVADLALAVTEVLTNALLHGDSFALLHVYDEGATWVCHVHDGGRAPLDPVAGLLPPAQPSDHGYGLWLARQLCAAVDVGHDRSGTHVRLHTRTAPRSA